MKGILDKYTFFNFCVGIIAYFLTPSINDAILIYIGIKFIVNSELYINIINMSSLNILSKEKMVQSSFTDVIKEFIFFLIGFMIASKI